jgi:hypothetical protein
MIADCGLALPIDEIGNGRSNPPLAAQIRNRQSKSAIVNRPNRQSPITNHQSIRRTLCPLALI